MNYITCLTYLVRFCPLKELSIEPDTRNWQLAYEDRDTYLRAFDSELITMMNAEINSQLGIDFACVFELVTGFSLRKIILADNGVVESYVLETNVMYGRYDKNLHVQYLFEIKAHASKAGVRFVDEPEKVKVKGKDLLAYNIIRKILEDYYSKESVVP